MALHVHQALAPQIEAEPGLADVYRRIEMPTSAVLARIERDRRADRLGPARGPEPRARRADAGARERGLRAGRPAVQPRQPEADRRDPVRQARPAGRPQDRERRAVDRRGGAGRARQGLSAAGAPARAPRPLEAEGHLHRQAAADGEPGDGPGAHDLRAGGGGDRAALEQRSEPAEHPDPHRRGTARARGLHRARRRVDPLGRLLADRAAHHGPPVRRRRPAARLRRRHRRPPRHRRRGVRRRRPRGGHAPSSGASPR